MKLTWYNVAIQHEDGLHSLCEKRNKMGRYAKRKEVEPIIRTMEKERKEQAQLMTSIKLEVQELRHHFSKASDDQHVFVCNDILNRLDQLVS